MGGVPGRVACPLVMGAPMGSEHCPLCAGQTQGPGPAGHGLSAWDLTGGETGDLVLVVWGHGGASPSNFGHYPGETPAPARSLNGGRLAAEGWGGRRGVPGRGDSVLGKV